MKTWKMVMIFAAGLIAIAMVIGSMGCNTVKKSSSSTKVQVDSSHTVQESHESGSKSDSTGRSTENGNYVRETVIEEFIGGSSAGEIKEDSTVFPESPEKYSQNKEKNIPAGPLMKRTTIKETGNYLKEQSAQVVKNDTATEKKAEATDLNKNIDDRSSNKESSRFPWTIAIIAGAILLVVGVVIYFVRKF